jgi:hypothetical protein
MFGRAVLMHLYCVQRRPQGTEWSSIPLLQQTGTQGDDEAWIDPRTFFAPVHPWLRAPNAAAAASSSSGCVVRASSANVKDEDRSSRR